ncbi:MAG: DUF4288 domain-containing protein [Pirellulales bacterium]
MTKSEERGETTEMTWYAAHIVMFVELKEPRQERFPVWENVVAFRANSEDEAFEKAERYGRAEEGDDGGSFRWGKSPARWVFAGVRKLTECESLGDRLEDGTELTYTEFELQSREDVKRLASGKPVQARFNERYRAARRRSASAEKLPRSAKRKRA